MVECDAAADLAGGTGTGVPRTARAAPESNIVYELESGNLY